MMTLNRTHPALLKIITQSIIKPDLMQLLQSTYRQSDNNDAIVRISIPKSSRAVSHKNK